MKQSTVALGSKQTALSPHANSSIHMYDISTSTISILPSSTKQQPKICIYSILTCAGSSGDAKVLQFSLSYVVNPAVNPYVFALLALVGPRVYDNGRLAKVLYLHLDILFNECRNSLFGRCGGELEGSSKFGKRRKETVDGSVIGKRRHSCNRPSGNEI